MEQKIKNLIDYCQGIYHKQNGKVLYERYAADIESVTPKDVVLVENEQLKMGMTPKEMLTFVDKLMNIFYLPLSEYHWAKPKEGSFLFYLMSENKALIERFEAFKAVLKHNQFEIGSQRVIDFLDDIMQYNEHLLKLENILFPFMERNMERFNGLKIMWSLHDEVREHVKQLKHTLQHQALDAAAMNVEIGRLYFNFYGLVKKQELILFPCAAELLSEADLKSMHRQSFEFSFAFIEAPPKPEPDASAIRFDVLKELFVTDTGRLNLEQISFLLEVLPIDLTFVDENDKVAYFSKPKERIFPRSAAVIGRNVRNCHPPESVHVVERILASFKAGEKDQAEFWIQMKGLFIYIQYIALRSREGDYRGTLEVTQEISALRALEGERRLLDW